MAATILTPAFSTALLDGIITRSAVTFASRKDESNVTTVFARFFGLAPSSRKVESNFIAINFSLIGPIFPFENLRLLIPTAAWSFLA